MAPVGFGRRCWNRSKVAWKPLRKRRISSWLARTWSNFSSGDVSAPTVQAEPRFPLHLRFEALVLSALPVLALMLCDPPAHFVGKTVPATLGHELSLDPGSGQADDEYYCAPENCFSNLLPDWLHYSE